MHTIDRTRRSLLGIAMAGLAGCVGSRSETSDGAESGELIIGATIRGDPADIERDFEPLTDWLESQTGRPASVHQVQDQTAAVNALVAGHAHAAMLSGGPAWVGWQVHGLDTLVVEADEEGRTHYTAAAWTRADTEIERLEDLEGANSCHTGDLTGAGMLIPMAYLAHEGLVTFESESDITAIRAAVDAFFGEPLVGGGYVGALQCLSLGRGDVAFVRASTPQDYCGGPDAEDWCLDPAEYELLIEFAEVPSHPIMVSPTVDDGDRDALREAFLALNDDQEGQTILEEVLGAPRLLPSTSEEHLGPYGELIEILPGIEDHLLE